MKKVLIAFLLIGFLTACGGQAADAPASPTGEPASPVDAPTAADTAIPPSEAPSPTAVIPTLTAPPPTESSAAQTGAISFTNDVVPIFQSRCWKCHGGDKIEEGLDLTTFAGLMTGSENGPVIVPGDIENSLLAEQIVTQEMPKRGPKLTPPQVQVILDWISQGALEN
ncbi:MAG: hypothetical protein IT313_07185 [Anaerolineales bacterium]|nr:hypothetical protein [Anaerolineales bacterium]